MDNVKKTEKGVKKKFREYGRKPSAEGRVRREDLVYRHYQAMRQHQTLEYVERMEKKWFSFNHDRLTIQQAFEKLGDYVDVSDPDTSFPNIEHGFQTAEAIRRDGHPDWFQLIGLIHDLGKLIFMWGSPEDGQSGSTGSQWGLSGDTWVLGCRIPDTVVFPELNKTNTDMKDPLLGSDFGIYQGQSPCGLATLKFAFGHDEYLYRVLKNAETTIPEEGLQMIRLHSCYPLHQHDSYERFLMPGDRETLDWVRKFNKYDLYTKIDRRPDLQNLWPYYNLLIEKYCPGQLNW